VIEPIQSLAFSMHSNPGVYALLLGSGVSRAAQIPTGWEIVMDLLGKLAAAAGENPETDLVPWYREKYGDEPEYSSLLAELAKTQAERQQLLRPYFEPNDQEREEGLKQPTAAHRAIARLVSQGFVKVIVTTNFDRLIEKALDDEGVKATTLSTPEQVKGAIPLVHTKCCVFKVHGDYQDTRIRNSEDELSSYPDEFDRLLDQIFDEFGLIVCGWSAEWDGGLRDAMLRAPSRRFTTYWALRGEAGSEAQRLVDQRCAKVIPIEAADGFFEKIQQTVESIEEFAKPHPLSPELAVASLKRYLASPEHRIRLTDLIDSTLSRAAAATTGEGFGVETSLPSPTAASVESRLRAHDSAYSIAIPMAFVAGMWAEDDHFLVWARALESLSSIQRLSGYSAYIEMKKYPAILLLYSLGIGALSSDRFPFLGQLFNLRVSDRSGDGGSVSLLSALFAAGRLARSVPSLDGSFNQFSMNQRVFDLLRESVHQSSPSDEQFSLVFDRFEMLLALAFPRRHEGSHYWSPLGMFLHRRENRIRILEEIKNSLSSLGRNSPLVSSGILDEDPAKSLRDIQEFEGFAARCAATWGIFY